MAFVGKEDDMPIDLRLRISCKHHGIMPRIPQVPILQGSVGGTFPSEEKLRNQKQIQRKHRSKTQFINDEMNKIKDPDAKRHFKKKYKGVKTKDHEKMK